MIKKYNSIDLFKFIMAIVVIASHTMYSPKGDVDLVWVILKSAVPFFFMTAGFLISHKIDTSNKGISIIKNYIKKIIVLYIAWSIIYIPITIYGFHNIENISISDNLFIIIRKYFFIGEQFYSWPLWYLLCTIYSLSLIYILLKLKVNKKIIFLIALILYVIGYYYTYMASNIDLYSGASYAVLQRLSSYFTRSGRILQGMLYICVGFGIYDRINYLRKYTKQLILSLCILLIINSMINIEVFIVLLYVVIFMICLSIDLRDNKFYYYLRKTSTIMYFTHMIFFFIYCLFVGFDNCKGLVGFMVCLISTIMLSLILNVINKNRNNKLLNIIFN